MIQYQIQVWQFCGEFQITSGIGSKIRIHEISFFYMSWAVEHESYNTVKNNGIRWIKLNLETEIYYHKI